jgi:hypothetical protein
VCDNTAEPKIPQLIFKMSTINSSAHVHPA